MTGSPPATTVTDSRRLTGPSLVLDRPGAVLEIHLDDAAAERAVELWRDAARRLLGEVGWAGESLAVRRFAGGASLALSAPIDTLYAAVDLNEAAWDEAAATLAGHLPPAPDPVAERLRRAIAEERRPALVAMRDAARAHGVTFLARLIAAWIYREEIKAAWAKLMEELRELWEKWFGKKTTAHTGEAGPVEPPPRTFGSFADPFLTGQANAMPWPILVARTPQRWNRREKPSALRWGSDTARVCRSHRWCQPGTSCLGASPGPRRGPGRAKGRDAQQGSP